MTAVTPLIDPVDRLILDEAASLIDGADVVILDAPGLAARVGARAGRLRVGFDSAAALDESGGGAIDSELFTGAEVVLARLPKSLDRLDDLARLVVANAAPGVTLVPGGRIKYMTLAMNEVLGRSFGDVRASLAWKKSRVLFASEPRSVDAPSPKRVRITELDLDVVAWGGVFAGASLDIGTRAMLSTFDRLPAFETAIDFGCGTGILAAQLKRARPSARVIASDDSGTAAGSARETAAANRLDIEVRHESYLESQPAASVDLIVLNPPFHEGGAVSTDIARAMFSAASRKLKPGGELRVVWNSHLRYRPVLESTIGSTTELTRTPKFTVTASIKPTN
jgi:16S rRNA (guanine1207-N2)-methyltransferase